MEVGYTIVPKSIRAIAIYIFLLSLGLYFIGIIHLFSLLSYLYPLIQNFNFNLGIIPPNIFVYKALLVIFNIFPCIFLFYNSFKIYIGDKLGVFKSIKSSIVVIAIKVFLFGLLEIILSFVFSESVNLQNSVLISLLSFFMGLVPLIFLYFYLNRIKESLLNIEGKVSNKKLLYLFIYTLLPIFISLFSLMYYFSLTIDKDLGYTQVRANSNFKVYRVSEKLGGYKQLERYHIAGENKSVKVSFVSSDKLNEWNKFLDKIYIQQFNSESKLIADYNLKEKEEQVELITLMKSKNSMGGIYDVIQDDYNKLLQFQTFQDTYIQIYYDSRYTSKDDILNIINSLE